MGDAASRMQTRRCISLTLSRRKELSVYTVSHKKLPSLCL